MGLIAEWFVKQVDVWAALKNVCLVDLYLHFQQAQHKQEWRYRNLPEKEITNRFCVWVQGTYLWTPEILNLVWLTILLWEIN